MDEARHAVDRVLAWYMLTAAWGTLRFDDHRGWPSGQLVEDDGGWDIGLGRTKTTGRGKKVEVRPLTVSKSSWLKCANWFKTGYQLLQAEAPFPRDYLLPVPGSSVTFKPRELRYEEFVGRTRWILSGLMVNNEVLGEEVAMGITAHSWRSFSPSAATAIGISKDMIDSLPAWGAQGGRATLARPGSAAATSRLQLHVQRENIQQIGTYSRAATTSPSCCGGWRNGA